MRIDRERIFGALKELRERDENEKGLQPEMSLSCFAGLRKSDGFVEDDSLCRECRYGNYEKTCERYLLPYKIEDAYR